MNTCIMFNVASKKINLCFFDAKPNLEFLIDMIMSHELNNLNNGYAILNGQYVI